MAAIDCVEMSLPLASVVTDYPNLQLIGKSYQFKKKIFIREKLVVWSSGQSMYMHEK